LKLSREIKTAILVISGILLFVFLYNYLKGDNLLVPKDSYFTEFDYNSLNSASPVTINGNIVGKIEDISYNYETGKTRVAFTVNQSLKIPKDSKIRMYEVGLMGGNGISIIEGQSSELAKPGDVLQSEVEFGLITNLSKNFSGLSSNIDTTVQSADTLLMSLNNLVIDDSDKGLKNAIAELNATIVSFKNLSTSFNSLIAKNDEKLTSVITNFDSISGNLAVISSDLKDVKFSETVAELDKTLASMNTIMANIENGKGSVGKLLNDEKLYANLEGASKQLEQLLQDMKLNPKRYVHFSLFGKKPKQYDAEGNEIKENN
jgi:phospholipid/cholesterol/gamma-HCH transport system substrate-binding protein